MTLLVNAPIEKRIEETEEWIVVHQEVEVLTIHFETGTMRVRYVETDPRVAPHRIGKVQTENISNESFFEQYRIVLATP